MRLIDDYSKTEIRFATPAIELHDEVESAIVTGLCSRNRNEAQLNWAVMPEGGGNPLLMGQGLCQSGSFHLELSDLPEISCGVRLLLVVEGDWGGVATAEFERRCQPLAAEEVLPSESSPIGTVCSIEYQPARDARSLCTRVCYRDALVVLEQSVDPAQCSGLAAKLAGP